MSCFAIQDVPKTEKIMFIDKDYHSCDVNFVVTDLKIAEIRVIEFSHLDARICVLNSYNSFESKQMHATIFRRLSDSNLHFNTLHFIRLDIPLKIGWKN
jgi:hypothetical protein